MNREPGKSGVVAAVAAFLFAATLVVAPAAAQTIHGTPGSPSATVTIDGKQIPPPPMKFGGVIKESALGSKQYWHPRVVPPKGAPKSPEEQKAVQFLKNDPAARTAFLNKVAAPIANEMFEWSMIP